MNEDEILPKTFSDLIMWMQAYASTFPAQRRGQAYFNYLNMTYPDIANAAQARSLDPFYSNDRIPEFLTYVSKFFE